MQPTIFIVHEDEAVRSSLGFLLETHGWTVSPSATPGDFLKGYRGTSGCLVLSQDMKETTGLACLAELRRQGVRIAAVIRTVVTTPALRRRATCLGALLVDALAVDALPAAIRQAVAGIEPASDC